MTRTKRLALAFYIGAMAAGAAIGITVDRWILRDQLMEELGIERYFTYIVTKTIKTDEGSVPAELIADQ